MTQSISQNTISSSTPTNSNTHTSPLSATIGPTASVELALLSFPLVASSRTSSASSFAAQVELTCNFRYHFFLADNYIIVRLLNSKDYLFQRLLLPRLPLSHVVWAVEAASNHPRRSRCPAALTFWLGLDKVAIFKITGYALE